VRRFQRLTLLVLSFFLPACGRLGFESHPLDPGERSPEDAGRIDPAADAGQEDDGEDDLPKDKPRLEDAGYVPPAPADAATPDGAAPAPGDAGTEPADAGSSAFSCADHGAALGCSSFDDSTPDEVYLNHTSGEGDVWIEDGVLFANTEGSSADAYAGVNFPRMYSGDLYLQLHVMFPSSGELRSINFVTIGNYADGGDYGVELDVVNGNLAFNSSTDGFAYSDHAVPRDQWLCLHLHVRLGSSSGSMTLDVDGTRALSVSNWDTVPSEGTRTLHVGIDWTRREQDAGRVRVDGFVIAQSPVPCP
jgi:hypothetical protein